MRPFITIGPEHIGKPWIHAFDRTWFVSGFIGKILPKDVGKRVYLIRNIIQVENDEQREQRRAKILEHIIQVENDEQRDRRLYGTDPPAALRDVMEELEHWVEVTTYNSIYNEDNPAGWAKLEAARYGLVKEVRRLIVEAIMGENTSQRHAELVADALLSETLIVIESTVDCRSK